MQRSLIPAQDASAADWVVAELTTFGESVLSVVPAGFDRYVRIFHPAYRRGDEDDQVAVMWADIAKTHGGVAHPGMQLNFITGRDWFESDQPPPDFNDWPEVGSLPSELARPLAAALTRHTATPVRCWFAIWYGWGDLQDDELICRSPRFDLPARTYHLLEGPIDNLVAGIAPSRQFPYGYRSPNLCWPDDHAWCVATEVDFNSTYVGCSDACSRDILGRPDIEALVVDPEGRGPEGW